MWKKIASTHIKIHGISSTIQVQNALIRTFDGANNPLDHLETYEALMHLQVVPKDIMC
jgi:hypothetical protein